MVLLTSLLFLAGESALLDAHDTRTASCTSLSEVKMLVLSRDDFAALSNQVDVGGMLARAAELQRKSYGVDEGGREEPGEEE
mgnify:CR=1 FL=1